MMIPSFTLCSAAYLPGYRQSSREWRPVLQVMSKEQRRAFRRLAMPAEGLILTKSCSIWGSGLVGLTFMLEGLTEPASLDCVDASSSSCLEEKQGACMEKQGACMEQQGACMERRVILASALHRASMMVSVTLTIPSFLFRHLFT